MNSPYSVEYHLCKIGAALTETSKTNDFSERMKFLVCVVLLIALNTVSSHAAYLQIYFRIRTEKVIANIPLLSVMA
jgi:hypothetical protein